jgi:hypothetical protein
VPVALACCCAPWRLLELAAALVEPRRRGPARQLQRLLARLAHTDGALAAYRAALLPFCNAAAKLAVDEAGPVRRGDHADAYRRGGDGALRQGDAAWAAGVVEEVNYEEGWCRLRPPGASWVFWRKPAVTVALRDARRSPRSGQQLRDGPFALPRVCEQWLQGLETQELAWYRLETARVAAAVAQLDDNEGALETARNGGGSDGVPRPSAFRKHVQGFGAVLTAHTAASDKRLHGEAAKLLAQVKRARECAREIDNNQEESVCAREEMRGARARPASANPPVSCRPGGVRARPFDRSSARALRRSRRRRGRQVKTTNRCRPFPFPAITLPCGPLSLGFFRLQLLTPRVLSCCRWASSLRRLRAELAAQASHANRAARHASPHGHDQWGPWRKTAAQVQRLCRAHAALALQDAALLGCLAGGLLSVYRTLPLAKDLVRAGARSPLDHRARGAVRGHALTQLRRSHRL